MKIDIVVTRQDGKHPVVTLDGRYTLRTHGYLNDIKEFLKIIYPTIAFQSLGSADFTNSSGWFTVNDTTVSVDYGCEYDIAKMSPQAIVCETERRLSLMVEAINMVLVGNYTYTATFKLVTL